MSFQDRWRSVSVARWVSASTRCCGAGNDRRAGRGRSRTGRPAPVSRSVCRAVTHHIATSEPADHLRAAHGHVPRLRGSGPHTPLDNRARLAHRRSSPPCTGARSRSTVVHRSVVQPDVRTRLHSPSDSFASRAQDFGIRHPHRRVTRTSAQGRGGGVRTHPTAGRTPGRSRPRRREPRWRGPVHGPEALWPASRIGLAAEATRPFEQRAPYGILPLWPTTRTLPTGCAPLLQTRKASPRSACSAASPS